jgi:ABC-type multidrug transport system permease subunit
MSFLWISAIKDFKRRLADPTAMALWLGMPLVIGGLMSLAFGGGGGITPKARMLLVDLDDSFVSNLLAGAAAGGGEDSVLEIERVELEEGTARMEEGEASGLLILPEGFGEALFKDEPTEMRLLTNPAQRILPGILRSGLEMLVEAVFYAQRILGEQLRTFATGPEGGASFFTDAVIAARSAQINRRMRELENVLFPPLLDFETEVIEEEDEAPQGIGLLLFPGILFMALLFIAQGMSDDLWSEKESGTLHRVLATPHSLATFLAGKILAGTLLMTVAGAIGLALGAVVFDFPPGGLLPGLLWCALSGAALLPLFLVLQIIASTRQAGNIISTIVVFPLMMLGGSLFPMEAMPGWMAAVGSWTPNGLAMVQFKAILIGEAELSAVARDAAILFGAAAILFLLTLRASGRFLQS